eukprot:15380091-Heterocapsa_arctica.AAC.1
MTSGHYTPMRTIPNKLRPHIGSNVWTMSGFEWGSRPIPRSTWYVLSQFKPSRRSIERVAVTSSFRTCELQAHLVPYYP